MQITSSSSTAWLELESGFPYWTLTVSADLVQNGVYLRTLLLRKIIVQGIEEGGRGSNFGFEIRHLEKCHSPCNDGPSNKASQNNPKIVPERFYSKQVPRTNGPEKKVVAETGKMFASRNSKLFEDFGAINLALKLTGITDEQSDIWNIFCLLFPIW